MSSEEFFEIGSETTKPEPRKRGRPAKVEAKQAEIASDLVPDIAVVESEQELLYWVGTLPGSPVESVDVGGVNFSKVTENISRGPSGTTIRTPVIGSIVPISARRIEKIKAGIRSTVIRFNREDDGQHEEPGTGKNLGDPHQRPRKGFLINIPTEEELRIRQQSGFAARRYTPAKYDEPVARYLFAVPCEDQNNPRPGQTYPKPLTETGLKWPI